MIPKYVLKLSRHITFNLKYTIMLFIYPNSKLDPKNLPLASQPCI